MYNSQHYISKINRNLNVIDKAPENIKEKCRQNITWAKNLSERLSDLDYDKREQAIAKIHEIMDDDYVDMGFELSDEQSLKK